jgi:hypothetical protein
MRRKKEVEASFESSVCEKICNNHLRNNIVNINIAVAELKNTNFRWSKKRWYSMGCPH